MVHIVPGCGCFSECQWARSVYLIGEGGGVCSGGVHMKQLSLSSLERLSLRSLIRPREDREM